MNAADTARRIARHALPSRRDLKAQVQRLEHEAAAASAFFTRLTDDRNQVYEAWQQMKADRDTAETELAHVAAERDALQAENATLRGRIALLTPAADPASDSEDTVTLPRPSGMATGLHATTSRVLRLGASPLAS